MNQEKIWDYFQNEMSDSFEGALPRLLFLSKKLKKGQKVLNIGVGNGQFELLLANGGIDIHSLDPNEKSIENIRSKLNLFEKAQVGYSQKIPFKDDYFDVVVMTEVLEHLSSDVLTASILDVKRVLKNNGQFLITVPDREILSNNVAICPNCESVFHRWGHVQSFTRESLQTLLESAQFEVKINEVRSFPDWPRKGFKNVIKSCIRYIFGRFGVAISQPNIFLLAIKR